MRNFFTYFIAFSFLLAITFFIILYFNHNITFLDTPNKLSKKQETISVRHIRWACDCADFIETNQELYLEDGNIDENKLFFLEADNDSLKTLLSRSTDVYGNIIVLIGSYYEDMGISRDYEMKTPEKPDKARVFRFHKLEIKNSVE